MSWGVNNEFCASTSFAESFPDHRHYRWVGPIPGLLFWEKQRPAESQPHNFRGRRTFDDSDVLEWFRRAANDKGEARCGRCFYSKARRRGDAGIVVYGDDWRPCPDRTVAVSSDLTSGALERVSRPAFFASDGGPHG